MANYEAFLVPIIDVLRSNIVLFDCSNQLTKILAIWPKNHNF